MVKYRQTDPDHVPDGSLWKTRQVVPYYTDNPDDPSDETTMTQVSKFLNVDTTLTVISRASANVEGEWYKILTNIGNIIYIHNFWFVIQGTLDRISG